MVAEESPSEHDLKAVKDALLNISGNVLLHDRFRALFTLKALKSEQAIQIISEGTPSFRRVITSRFNSQERISRSICVAETRTSVLSGSDGKSNRTSCPSSSSRERIRGPDGAARSLCFSSCVKYHLS